MRCSVWLILQGSESPSWDCSNSILCMIMSDCVSGANWCCYLYQSVPVCVLYSQSASSVHTSLSTPTTWLVCSVFWYANTILTELSNNKWMCLEIWGLRSGIPCGGTIPDPWLILNSWSQVCDALRCSLWPVCYGSTGILSHVCEPSTDHYCSQLCPDHCLANNSHQQMASLRTADDMSRWWRENCC